MFQTAPLWLGEGEHPQTSWEAFGGAGLWTGGRTLSFAFLPPLGGRGRLAHSPESCLHRMLSADVTVQALHGRGLAAVVVAGQRGPVGGWARNRQKAGRDSAVATINVVIHRRPSAHRREAQRGQETQKPSLETSRGSRSCQRLELVPLATFERLGPSH